jgi:hypothetical protein
VDAVRVEQSVPVPAGGAVVVARSGDPRRNGGFVPDLVVPNDFYLANATDEIRIDDPWGAPLDTVRYGGPGFSVRSGIALERRRLTGPGTAANFALATTTFGLGDRGTPGNPNDADPGFPAHVALTGGLPLPGQTVSLRLRGPVGAHYFLVPSALRADTPLPGPVRLGVGLDLFPLAFLLPGWIGALPHGTAGASIPIPAEGALSGRTFYLQLVILGNGGLPTAVSDVARLVVG